jgi:hypothetical protein
VGLPPSILRTQDTKDPITLRQSNPAERLEQANCLTPCGGRSRATPSYKNFVRSLCGVSGALEVAETDPGRGRVQESRPPVRPHTRVGLWARCGTSRFASPYVGPGGARRVLCGSVRGAERNRMARDLHDGALLDLAYALAEVEIARALPEDAELDARLGRTVDTLRRVGQELRAAVNDLRLGEEERDRPLPRLVESLVERNRGMTPNCRIELLVEEGLPSTPQGAFGTNFLRILQEALTNVRRHSGAGEVMVGLRLEGDQLLAEVSDDGLGFDPKGSAGIGLRSMRERTAALGGKLEIESEPGEGTRVRLRAPILRVPRVGLEAGMGTLEKIDPNGE